MVVAFADIRKKECDICKKKTRNYYEVAILNGLGSNYKICWRCMEKIKKFVRNEVEKDGLDTE